MQNDTFIVDLDMQLKTYCEVMMNECEECIVPSTFFLLFAQSPVDSKNI